MEDFEDKLFDYLCDSRELLNVDKFKKVKYDISYVWKRISYKHKHIIS